MNEILKEGLTFLSNITPDQWTAIGQTVMASGALSPLLIAVQKLLNIKKGIAMFATVVAACFVIVGLAYLKGWFTFNPVYALTVFVVLTNAVYYAFVKPARKNLLPLAVQKWAEAKLYKQQKLSQRQLADEEVPGRILPGDFSH